MASGGQLCLLAKVGPRGKSISQAMPHGSARVGIVSEGYGGAKEALGSRRKIQVNAIGPARGIRGFHVAIEYSQKSTVSYLELIHGMNFPVQSGDSRSSRND